MFKIIIERKATMNQTQIDEITKNVARTVEKNVLWYALGIGSAEKTDSGDNKTRNGCDTKDDVQPKDLSPERIACLRCFRNGY